MNETASAKVAAIREVPGKELGIWALVLAFLIPVVGLVLGVVALAISRRAGVPNTLAGSAVAVSIVLIAGAVITTIAIWG